MAAGFKWDTHSNQGNSSSHVAMENHNQYSDSSSSSDDSDSDGECVSSREAGPGVIDHAQTSDNVLTLVDDEDTGLLLQAPSILEDDGQSHLWTSFFNIVLNKSIFCICLVLNIYIHVYL